MTTQERTRFGKEGGLLPMTMTKGTSSITEEEGGGAFAHDARAHKVFGRRKGVFAPR